MITRLETERLILRKPVEADVAAEAEFYATDRSKFVGGPMTLEQSWRSMAMLIGHWDMRGYGFFALEEKATGAYLGRVGPWFPEGWPEREIGWTMMNNAEGRGFATEAAKAVLHHVYHDLGWDTAISLIDPANTRSKALAERLGASYAYDFTHERYGHMNVWRHVAPTDGPKEAQI